MAPRDLSKVSDSEESTNGYGVIAMINNLHPPVATAAPKRKETNQWTPVTSVAPVIHPQTHPVTSVAPDPD